MSDIVSTPLTLEVGLRSEFMERLNAQKTYYQDWCTRIASTRAEEHYAWLGSVPQVREFGQGRLVRGLNAETYSLKNLKYESSLAVDRDEISDDQTGQIRIRIQELAQRAATHKDYLIGQLLINGEGADYQSFDGVPFFDTQHVFGDSGEQSNLISHDVVDEDAVTTAEFKAAMQVAIARMLGFRDDQGQPLNTSADGLVAVVPPALLFPASEAVSATIVNSTTNVLSGAASIAAFPWLTDPHEWYLLKTNNVLRPFIFQDRGPIEFQALEGQSEENFMRERWMYGVRARYKIAYAQPLFAIKVTFATAEG